MNMKILNTLCLSLVLFGFAATAQSAEDASEAVPDTVEVKKPGRKMARPLFGEHWNRIQTIVRKPAYEIQQTRTASGVRGEEGEAGLESQFYLKEGGGVPSRLEINNVILQLQEMISEQEFLMAACYEQLGDPQKALAIYNTLVKTYPQTKYGKLAQNLLDAIAPEKSR